ncbi:MAG: biotin--[acetyl-CoA-carboxylase] ligase, partial [Sphingobacteriales bacterium]
FLEIQAGFESQMPQFIDKICLEKEQVDSTNSFLQSWAARDSLPEGAAVWAHHQTEGRGQRGTNWQSNAGENILTSVLLFPNFLKPESQFWLSKTIAIGVRNFISRFLTSEDVYIKWPNDIYVKNKKIAGILIENSIQFSSIKNSIIGIGININQNETLLPSATSLKNITNQNYNLKHLLPTLYMELETIYLQLANNNLEIIEAFYQQHLYGKGLQMGFYNHILQTSFTGEITGTTNTGALCINTQNGLQIFDLKQVSLL